MYNFFRLFCEISQYFFIVCSSISLLLLLGEFSCYSCLWRMLLVQFFFLCVKWFALLFCDLVTPMPFFLMHFCLAKYFPNLYVCCSPKCATWCTCL